MKIDEIRNKLRNPDWFINSFSTLAAISYYVNNPSLEHEGRELTIRALEHSDELTPENKKILYALARQIGLFPYVEPELLSTSDLLAYEFHRPYNMDEDGIVFHSVQAQVYRELIGGRNVILSAPTSFGKSLLIDAIIATGKYSNIAVIVPTIALIDETRRRLLKFRNNYKIITHTEQLRSDKNIFVMTQERALSYPDIKPIEFFVIDEFYKLNSNIDSDRAIMLNKIFYELHKTGAQFYLLGPNIESVHASSAGKLEYNFIETDFNNVVAETTYIDPKPTAKEATLKVCMKIDDSTLIYCKSPASVRGLALFLIENGISISNDVLQPAIQWISDNYHEEWLLVKALKSGIGIHHGKLPRSIAQFLVRNFNDGIINYLICTSTLIEGVNTSAKNVIVFDNMIATKKLDYFTFNNIKGRSGRMFKHFIGRVFIMHEEPQLELPFVDFPIFTQDTDTSNELIIQIDWDDLTDISKEKVFDLYKQSILPIEIIKANVGISPDSQIALANELLNTPDSYNSYLNWSRYPKYEELKVAASLIWEFLGGKSKPERGIVVSANQLCFKIFNLIENHDVKKIIQLEIDNGTEPNEAVDNTLDFIRNWAGFHFPRLLKALNLIQEAVFKKLNMKPGNYTYFANTVENLFMPSSVMALEEYGLPYQISMKIADKLMLDNGLDESLIAIKNLSLDDLQLSSFEKNLVSIMKKTL
ncbi:MAG: DEAD/DEAH box helicase [Nitrospirae bacterium]|nr:DEAD/DEAH box helicase [Nitrospirota bacterium]